MELTHTYKGKTTTTNIRTTVGASVLRFIINHADVFEALSRQGQPFGGSLLALNQTTSVNKTDHPDESITRVQQQLDEIKRKVTSLSDDLRALHTDTISASKPERNRAGTVNDPDAWRNVIGIERFRALRHV